MASLSYNGEIVMPDFKIAAAFDTETTNIELNGDIHAFPILYTFNDLRNIRIQEYNEFCDQIKFFRSSSEAYDFIEDIIEWGIFYNITPIICVYNMTFDLFSIMPYLMDNYNFKVAAQNSQTIYTLDLYMKDSNYMALRIWDTFHLETRGLSAMGVSCNICKLEGSWDYSLIRTQETPLTESEREYAARDVQVIPAYLKFLLDSNEWMDERDLGTKIITKTSITRQAGIKRIGKLKISDDNNMSILTAFEMICRLELPRDYDTYALRKACIRGGLAFTSANMANKVVRNVASLDVTSMHHAYINGRYIPELFSKSSPSLLMRMVNEVINTDIETILNRYYKPFYKCFHIKIRIDNIRLKNNSCFKKWGIGILAASKFKDKEVLGQGGFGNNDSAKEAEDAIRKNGYKDYVSDNNIMAFGKLLSADWCEVNVNEIEMWCISRVYEWDNIEVIYGESTIKQCLPPDYITLQSNTLFDMKQEAKKIVKLYEPGRNYEYEIPDSIPNELKNIIYKGEASKEFINGWYNVSVKGTFNGIYGVNVQDIFKPEYIVSDGEVIVDTNTSASMDNFSISGINHPRVLYTYGMRIAAGSRMHLIIAMELLYKNLKNRIDILGGDTDSIKMRCDFDVTNEEITEALEPLHKAVRESLNVCQSRIRKNHPELCSSLNHVGEFDIEKCGNSDRYIAHLEAWNKARISLDSDMKVHITCAGLSKPEDKFNLEDFANAFISQSDNGIEEFEKIAPYILGYNTIIGSELSYSLERTYPIYGKLITEDITDYLGTQDIVCEYEVPAIYSTGRVIGDTLKESNSRNVKYLKDNNIPVNDTYKELHIINGKCQIIESDLVGIDSAIIAEAITHKE